MLIVFSFRPRHPDSELIELAQLFPSKKIPLPLRDRSLHEIKQPDTAAG